MDKIQILNEFKQKIEDIYGLYQDALQGFVHNLERLKKAQEMSVVKLGLTIEYLDTLSFMYGNGDPSSPSTEILHTSTQGEYKLRNQIKGKNSMTLGNLCISQTYQYWEDYYREKLSNSIGKNKNDIISDFFGDIRNYRRSIIHTQAIAIKQVDNNKILKWFKSGDVINPTEDQIKEFIYLFRKEIERLKQKY